MDETRAAATDRRRSRDAAAGLLRAEADRLRERAEGLEPNAPALFGYRVAFRVAAAGMKSAAALLDAHAMWLEMD